MHLITACCLPHLLLSRFSSVLFSLCCSLLHVCSRVHCAMAALNSLIDVCHFNNMLVLYDQNVINCTLMLFQHEKTDMKILATTTVCSLPLLALHVSHVSDDQTSLLFVSLNMNTGGCSFSMAVCPFVCLSAFISLLLGKLNCRADCFLETTKEP